MKEFYIKRCTKCNNIMIQEIRYNLKGYSYLVWVCKCGNEEVVLNGNYK